MATQAANPTHNRRVASRWVHLDRVLLATTLILVGLGLVMVYSSSAILADEKFGDAWYYFRKQAAHAAVGLVLMVIVANIPYRAYRMVVYPILGITALMLLLVLIPEVGGAQGGGATRWFQLGSVRFQPSELAKIALIIYLAYSLDKKQANIKSFSIGILPHLVISGVVLALIMLEPDFGTTVTLGAILFLMMFLAGVNLKHLLYLLLAAIPAFYFVMMGAEYRVKRLTTFLHPWDDPADSGFQIIQSWIAFHSGGIFGAGLGAGRQKLFYLPEAHTDFVFSVMGEELGLAGVVLTLGVFLVFVIRGIRVAHRAVDLFGVLLGLGVVSAIGLQTVINIAVVMGLLPTKGIVLPFISYGGTSLLVTMIMMGMLMNISASRSQFERRVRDPSWQTIEGRQQVLRPLPGFSAVVPHIRGRRI